jgi:hypothetical protein
MFTVCVPFSFVASAVIVVFFPWVLFMGLS